MCEEDRNREIVSVPVGKRALVGEVREAWTHGTWPCYAIALLDGGGSARGVWGGCVRWMVLRLAAISYETHS